MFGWLKRLFTRTVKKVARRIVRMATWLSGASPGWWSSNHLAEAEHNTGWNFVAIRALAKQCGRARVVITGKNPADKKALSRLIKRPNKEQSKSTFLFQCAQQIAITGSAMVWIVRNKLRVPMSMYVIPTGLLTPQRPNAEYPEGWYRVAPLASWVAAGDDEGYMPTGAVGQMIMAERVDAREIKRIAWPHHLNLSDGLSALAAGSVQVDIAEQLDTARWSHLRNQGVPGMVFTEDKDAPATPEEIEAFREDLKERNSGAHNRGRDLKLPPGITPHDLGQTAVEMDYANAWPQCRDTVMALHGVPPIAAGVTQAGVYAALYAALLQFIYLTVEPLLEMIAEELWEAIGPAFPGCGFELLAKTIDDPQITKLQADIVENRLKTDIAAGNVLTVDEYREIRGMPPFGDERGKAFVGIKVSASVKDEKPSEPGVQGDPRTEEPPGDETTGIPDPVRTAAPKLNGKSRMAAR